jgi:hypothetical protein
VVPSSGRVKDSGALARRPPSELLLLKPRVLPPSAPRSHSWLGCFPGLPTTLVHAQPLHVTSKYRRQTSPQKWHRRGHHSQKSTHRVNKKKNKAKRFRAELANMTVSSHTCLFWSHFSYFKFLQIRSSISLYTQPGAGGSCAVRCRLQSTALPVGDEPNGIITTFKSQEENRTRASQHVYSAHYSPHLKAKETSA